MKHMLLLLNRRLSNVFINSGSKDQLGSLLSTALDILDSCKKAEIVNQCLNTELEAFDLKTHVAIDKTSLLVNDEGLCKVRDFFKGKSYHPVLINQHTNRVGTVIDFANENKIDLLCTQGRFRKKTTL